MYYTPKWFPEPVVLKLQNWKQFCISLSYILFNCSNLWFHRNAKQSTGQRLKQIVTTLTSLAPRVRRNLIYIAHVLLINTASQFESWRHRMIFRLEFVHKKNSWASLEYYIRWIFLRQPVNQNILANDFCRQFSRVIVILSC